LKNHSGAFPSLKKAPSTCQAKQVRRPYPTDNAACMKMSGAAFRDANPDIFNILFQDLIAAGSLGSPPFFISASL
jgi:hypothetical protein